MREIICTSENVIVTVAEIHQRIEKNQERLITGCCKDSILKRLKKIGNKLQVEYVHLPTRLAKETEVC